MIITVRYYAAAKAATGVESETLVVPDGATLADALDAVLGAPRDAGRVDVPGGKVPGVQEHSAVPALAEVLRRCSFLVNEIAAKDPNRVLESGDTVDVLPPFAGG